MSRCFRNQILPEGRLGLIPRRDFQLVLVLFLILFAQSLGVSFAVRIEEFPAALLPRRFEFGC